MTNAAVLVDHSSRYRPTLAARALVIGAAGVSSLALYEAKLMTIQYYAVFATAVVDNNSTNIY